MKRLNVKFSSVFHRIATLLLVAVMIAAFAPVQSVNAADGTLLELSSTEIGKITVKASTDAVHTGYRVKYSSKSSLKSATVRYYAASGSLTKTISAKGKKYFQVTPYTGSGSAKKYGVSSAVKSARAITHRVAYVNRVKATLHKSKKSSSASIQIKYRTKVDYYGAVSSSSSGSWIKVKYNGKTYYQYQKKKESAYFAKARTSFDTYRSLCKNEYQLAVVNCALEWYNKSAKTYYAHPYSMGLDPGEADSKGKYPMDCSGFVVAAINGGMQDYFPSFRLSSKLTTLYNQTDVLGGAYQTVKICGKTYDWNKLQPGDVLFMKDDPKGSASYDHAVLYLGNREFIQMTKAWNHVCIMPCRDKYATELVKAVRFIPGSAKTAANGWKKVILESDVYGSVDYDTKSLSYAMDPISSDSTIKILFTNTIGTENYAYISYGYESGYEDYGFIYYKPENLVDSEAYTDQSNSDGDDEEVDDDSGDVEEDGQEDPAIE